MCHFHREHVLDHQGCAEDHQEARCGWEPLRAPQKSTAGYVCRLWTPGPDLPIAACPAVSFRFIFAKNKYPYEKQLSWAIN